MNQKDTTTIRISYKTQELLKELKKQKEMPICSIIHLLAENELTKIYKLEEILNGKNNS